MFALDICLSILLILTPYKHFEVSIAKYLWYSSIIILAEHCIEGVYMSSFSSVNNELIILSSIFMDEGDITHCLNHCLWVHLIICDLSLEPFRSLSTSLSYFNSITFPLRPYSHLKDNFAESWTNVYEYRVIIIPNILEFIPDFINHISSCFTIS